MIPSSGGILIVDKEVGMTSAAVVSRARRLLGERRVGHTGTLDPFASGVLPVCFGRATAASHYMLHWNKRYLCGISLGMSTDTMDCTGEEALRTPEADWRRFAVLPDDAVVRELSAAAKSLVGEREQQVPVYSAVKVNGKRLYRYAREGCEVACPKRDITVYDAVYRGLFTDEATGFPVVMVEFLVSSGTYVRVLAEDFGRAIGCYAHARSLRRLAAGHLSVDQSVTVDDLFGIFRSLGRDTAHFLRRITEKGIVLPLSSVFGGWPRVFFDDKGASDLVHGRKVPVVEGRSAPPADSLAERNAGAEPGMFAFFSGSRLIAVGRAEEGYYCVKRVFTAPEDAVK
ncbi:MAG TPA: tRNA pseudouridine(55) synthase TruB [Bacillota bacterium]|nr:tRNA pseudouridine(55) synthase TruB [Bacillota bacterium]